MLLRTALGVAAFSSLALNLVCAEPIQLAHQPALSPDGSTLAFSWRGDIWTVGIKGGNAVRLTENPAIESMPAFSPDGKEIAFVSDRDRGNQVFVMPATGGVARQLTWHSEGYEIQEWMPDGQSLLIGAVRDFSWNATRASRMAVLNARERHPENILFDDYAAESTVSPDGRRVLFTREGEVWWRQGYHGSRAGQVWLLNRDDGSVTQVLGEDSECRWPLWKSDGSGFYYVSNRDGVHNLWEHSFSAGKEQQRTSFKTDSVVFPTISRDGKTVVFRHQFDFYAWRPGTNSTPEKITIQREGDVLDSAIERRVLDRATDVTFTSDGLQMAFISGGDVWVMDTELCEPRQVTNTAEEERDVTFAPDDKSLWYVSDAGGQPDIWKATPQNPLRYWWENTGFNRTRVTNDPDMESRVKFTRDGKTLGFVKGRGDLWVANVDGQQSRRLFESASTPRFDFSPDGKWIAYSCKDEWFNSDIWIVPTDGSRPRLNLSRHPNDDVDPVWSPDGKAVAWLGKLKTGDADIFYAWVRPEDDERTKRERTLIKAREKIAKAAPKSDKPATKAPPKAPSSEPASSPATAEAGEATGKGVELDGIHDRVHRIAVPNSSKSGLEWSPDSKKLAFNSTVEGKRGVCTVELLDDDKPKLFGPVACSQMQWLKHEDQIVGLSDGQPVTITSKGVSTWKFKARQSFAHADKQRAVFDQCWRVMRDWYYDENLGNRNWNDIRAKYTDLASTAPDMRGLVDVVHLMLGELNGSHLGFSLSPSLIKKSGWNDETAHLGLRFDSSYAGPGWKVRDVLPKGPASHSLRKIEPGEIILWVDGREVQPSMDNTEVLNGPLDRDITLTVRSAADAEREVILRPISYATARQLLYDKWIKDNREMVEKSSNGKLGYLHISKMDNASFQLFQEELYAAGADKDGLVIDVRENGGGSTTDLLLTALTQPRHATTVPRGGSEGYPDQERLVFACWSKPIAVLCNQNSYSNAEVFSHAIKTLKRGKLIGVPTAGAVISTGSTEIMDIGTLRLPFRGWYGINDGLDMELNGAKPDYVVWPKPGELPRGIDAQLQKAIEVLQVDVEKSKQRAQQKLFKASERK